MTARLLIVHHSHGGSTDRLAAAVADGARDPVFDGAIEVHQANALTASSDDVLDADAIVVATAAHFGFMSGAIKFFFERIYHDVLDRSVSKPWALLANGDTDVDGAIDSVLKITGALGWRAVAAPLKVVGPVDAPALGRAYELGQLVAAHLSD